MDLSELGKWVVGIFGAVFSTALTYVSGLGVLQLWLKDFYRREAKRVRPSHPRLAETYDELRSDLADYFYIHHLVEAIFKRHEISNAYFASQALEMENQND